MSEQAQHPEYSTNGDLIAITQRVGETWRCLFASHEDESRPRIVETKEVRGTVALDKLLKDREPSTIYSILAGSSTVCRTTTLPDIETDQMMEALRLQAESKFLGGTPSHRRAMAALDCGAGETNRVGLIVAWPENAAIDFPECLHDAFFIPDAASIASLLDGLRPTEPILYADSTDGTVTIALSHANGAALRATREDSTSTTTFVEGISRIVSETAMAHNHTPAFTEGIIASLTAATSTHSFDEPILILPDSIIESSMHRVQGISDSSQAWWSHWGIVVGGLLTATGSMQSLATMKIKAPILNPTMADRFVNTYSKKSIAIKLSVAAILLLAFGSTIVNGIKLSALEFLNPELDAQYSEVVETRKQQIVYKELGDSAWPMTKIVADVVNNVPIGVEIESIRVNVGEPISLRGRAMKKDGKSAAELIASMQENLQTTGLFKDIQFSYDPAGTYGDREFDLWATVVNPLKRPRYDAKRDFGQWTYAMRQAGLQPEEAIDHEEVEVITGSVDTGSPLSEANPELAGVENETPDFLDDEENSYSDREVSRPTGGGGSDAGKRSDTPNQGGGGGPRIPEPLDPALIALMSEDEARISLTDVTEGLQHVSRGDDETKKRLRNEMRLLLDRLKEVQR
jgi:hypothetical protein